MILPVDSWGAILTYIMGGKRQHFIPRFLQRGFASRKARDVTYTWVFRRDSSPFETNIVNVGVQSQFYTEEGNNELDDLITAAEGSFSILIHNLRNGVISSLSDPKLPELIVHFETRTRHIRQNLFKLGDSAVSLFLEQMKKEDFFADWSIRRILKNPKMLRSALARELKDQHLSQQSLDLLTKLSMPLVKNFILDNKSKFGELAEELKPLLRKELAQGVKSGHIKGLKQPSALKPKVQIFENLTYSVHVQNGDPLILGDSILIFHVDGPKSYKTFLGKEDKLKCVYIPLDSRHILVGVNEGVIPKLNDIQEIIARCSLEYFIGTENSTQNQKLHEKIGTDASLLTRQEMEALFEETFMQ